MSPDHVAASPSVTDGLAVVLVAAGSGTRLGYGMPKALVPVAGRPVLARALDGVLAALPGVRVVVTVPAGDTDLTSLAEACGARAVTGGATRAQSVARALAVLPEGVEHVLVHDAARCLTPPAVVERVVTALRDGAVAVVPVTPVTDTVRAVDALGRSTGTVDRSRLRSVQTPQGFDRALLTRVNVAAGLLSGAPDGAARATVPGSPAPTAVPGSAAAGSLRGGAGPAHQDPHVVQDPHDVWGARDSRARQDPQDPRDSQDPEGITDDASLVERYAPELPVRFVAGHEESFKITRPLDLLLAGALVDSRGTLQRGQ